MFNPGVLMRIRRATDQQYIIPGGSRYDWVKGGGAGRGIPAVGRYPNGAPWGGILGDGPDGPAGSWGPYIVGGLLVGVLLWNLRK